MCTVVRKHHRILLQPGGGESLNFKADQWKPGWPLVNMCTVAGGQPWTPVMFIQVTTWSPIHPNESCCNERVNSVVYVSIYQFNMHYIDKHCSLTKLCRKLVNINALPNKGKKWEHSHNHTHSHNHNDITDHLLRTLLAEKSCVKK